MTEATFQAARALLRGRSNEPPLQPAPRHCPLPASYAQARLWFLDRLHPESRAYNLAMACRLRGRLDVSALHKALTALVHRHEILRTTLRMVEGELTQQIAPPWPFELPVADVTDLESWTAEKVAQRFDLEHGPLLRVDLARLASDHACLLVVQHHAICDAWSFEVFMRELGALYEEAPLEALPLHYADFAYWEQQRLRTNGHASLVEYWTHQLDGNAPLLQLPADRARLSRSRRRAGNQIMRVPRGLTETLKALAAREGATLYMVLLGVFQTLLHRYTGEEDVLVGTPIAGRNHAQLQNVLGLFINTLPMRVDLSGRPVFRQLLGRVRETVTGALAHQELPLEAITRELRLSRSGDSAPLFEVLFAFQNIPRTPWRWSGLEIEAWEVPPPETKFDLALTMQETPEGLNAVFEYDADRFEDATITRMLQHLATLFEAVAAQPDRPIADLPLASLEPSDWNHTAVPYPRHEPVHRLFEQQVHRTPTAVAVVSDEESLTYDALNRRANQLAHRLAQLRLAPEALVGLRLRRSASFIVAQLAVLKAGLTYVPLDAEQSNARTADIMKKLAAVVMDGPMPTTAANPVLAGDPSLRLESDGDLDERVTSEQLAYVMFTSGSTGIPRGVCIPHRGIVRLVRGTTYARLGPGEVFLQLAPPSFDAATFEVWGALLGGNTLVVAPSRPLAIAEIGEIIRRHEVTMLWLTSGLFELFVDGGLDYLGSVRQLLTGGDTLSASHAERFVRRMKHCQLINCYGPTENTTFTCTHTVEHVDAADIIPIGRPPPGPAGGRRRGLGGRGRPGTRLS
jgi:aspartate racemase